MIGDKRLTASQSSIGTPTYMSPEQILRPRSLDHRTDVYSAAIVLWEMLAGRPPFDAESEYEIKKLQIESDAPDVREVAPDVPAHISAALSIALRKHPDERFTSAGELLRALETRGESETAATLISAPVLPPRLRPRLRRHPWILAAAGGLLTFTLFLVFLVHQPSPTQNAGAQPVAAPGHAPDPGKIESPSSRVSLALPVAPSPAPVPRQREVEPREKANAAVLRADIEKKFVEIRRALAVEDFVAARRALDEVHRKLPGKTLEFSSEKQQERALEERLQNAVRQSEKRAEVPNRLTALLQEGRAALSAGQVQKAKEIAQGIVGDPAAPEPFITQARNLLNESTEREAKAVEYSRPLQGSEEEAEARPRPQDGVLLRLERITGPVLAKRGESAEFQIQYVLRGSDTTKDLAAHLSVILRSKGGASSWNVEKKIVAGNGGGSSGLPIAIKIPRSARPGVYVLTVILEEQVHLSRRWQQFQFEVE